MLNHEEQTLMQSFRKLEPGLQNIIQRFVLCEASKVSSPVEQGRPVLRLVAGGR